MLPVPAVVQLDTLGEGSRLPELGPQAENSETTRMMLMGECVCGKCAASSCACTSMA